MKSLASYLITMFAVMFWFFRLVIAFTTTLKIDIGIEAVNLTYEIIMLFVTLFAIILVIKRNIIGALIYFSSYLLYFGLDAVTLINNLIEGNLAVNQYMSLAFAVTGILLATATLLDILFNKDRVNNGSNKKTDWFYKNEQYDRKFDERADKNNYRTM